MELATSASQHAYAHSQKDEEYGGILARSVVAAEICCLEGRFTNQSKQDAAEADEQELSSPESFHKEGTEDVAGEGRSDCRQMSEVSKEQCANRIKDAD